MRAARNIAVIAVLALGVAFLPRGGDFADAVLTAITMGFLAAFAYAIYGFSRENQLTLLSINEPRKGVLYGSFGLIVLLIAGASKMFSTGPGTVAWLGLLAAAVIGIWLVWSDARSV